MYGMYRSNINPPRDLKTYELFALWEREIYTRAGKKSKIWSC
jgi:hypothetical protein